MNKQLKTIHEDALVSLFEVLSQYVHGETEENIKRLLSGREVWEL
jgi:hypothetical protein